MKSSKLLNKTDTLLEARTRKLIEEWYQIQTTLDLSTRERKIKEFKSRPSWKTFEYVLNEKLNVDENLPLVERQKVAYKNFDIQKKECKKLLSKIQKNQFKAEGPLQKAPYLQQTVLLLHAYTSINRIFLPDTQITLENVFFISIQALLVNLDQIISPNGDFNIVCVREDIFQEPIFIEFKSNIAYYFSLYESLVQNLLKRPNITPNEKNVQQEILALFFSVAFNLNDIVFLNMVRDSLAFTVKEGDDDLGFKDLRAQSLASTFGYDENEKKTSQHHFLNELQIYLERLLADHNQDPLENDKKLNQNIILTNKVKNIEDFSNQKDFLFDILNKISSKKLSESDFAYINKILGVLNETIGQISYDFECQHQLKVQRDLKVLSERFENKFQAFKNKKEKLVLQAARHASFKTQVTSIQDLSQDPERLEVEEVSASETQIAAQSPIKNNKKQVSKKKKKRNRGKKKAASAGNDKNKSLEVRSLEEILPTVTSSSENLPAKFDVYEVDKSYLYKSDIILYIPAEVKKAMKIVTDFQRRIYIVGGYPRDIMMNSGKISNDIDMIAELSPEEFASLFAEYSFNENQNITGLYTFKIENIDIDLLIVPHFSLFDNALKRDIPSNAIFLDRKGRTYTPHPKTVEDLANPDFELRLIADNAYELFEQNPICILRLIDLSTRLKKPICQETLKAMSSSGHHLRKLAFQTFKAHFIKLFFNGHAVENYWHMQNLELFEYIFPSMSPIMHFDPILSQYMNCILKSWDTESSIKSMAMVYGLILLPNVLKLVWEGANWNTATILKTHFLEGVDPKYNLQTAVSKQLTNQYIPGFFEFYNMEMQRQHLEGQQRMLIFNHGRVASHKKKNLKKDDKSEAKRSGISSRPLN